MITEQDVKDNVTVALKEDIGSGDVTAAVISAETTAKAAITLKENAIICGQAWANEAFHQIDKGVQINWNVLEGDYALAGAKIADISGNARALLTAERTALNFLQTLSATATATAKLVNKIKDTKCRLLDTRKTIPGLRQAQKYAVTMGGGYNHRFGLFDAVLIKENHIFAAGSIAAAIAQARKLHPSIKVEVEVESMDELSQAIESKPDVIMLDNFNLDQLKQAVQLAEGNLPLEASGDITLDNIASVAATGVDYISTGSITKNISAIDLSMRIQLDN